MEEKSFSRENLKEKIAELLNKSQWTENEKKWILQYLEDTDTKELHDLMKQQFKDDEYNAEPTERKTAAKTLQKICEEIDVAKKKNKASIVRPLILKIAAVTIIIILGLGISRSYKTGTKKKVIKTEVNESQFNNSFLAESNKAVLTLQDGSSLIVDDKKNGILSIQGNTKVLKHGRNVFYKTGNKKINKLLFNTITTGSGGYYLVNLGDGSKVWLNDLSSLRFPTAFVGKERRVEVTGEAYFEVTKNSSMPFIVKVNNAEVKVLGTHFNITAYKDEDVLKTTLLEGEVKFVNGDYNSTLKPGQQSQLEKNGHVKVLRGVDVAEVVAWKNGFFDFKGANIELVTRQLSKYYGVEIVYNNKIKELFYAKFSRATKLSDVLKALALTGKVRFAIEGKKVTVMR